MIPDSPIPGLPIHHIGIAVASIEDTHSTYELVTGASSSPIETVESQGVRVCFVGWIELLEPTHEGSTVARFLERRGPGLHHIAYATRNIERELERLAEAGLELIDTHPRPGAFGHSVAFLHPKGTAGTLIELVETHAGSPPID